jgi:DNA-binding response OmpR family regulator
MDAGFDHYFVKPIDTDVLLALVADIAAGAGLAGKRIN